MSRLLRSLPLAVAVAGLLLAGLLWLPADGGGEGDGAELRDALAHGNRLARRGELEAAVDAYAAGWTGDPGGESASLAYNLGTTYHRLGRLPEALLWYRRAEVRSPGDRALAENLDLARTELAAARYPAPGAGGWLASHPAVAPTAAVLLAWAAAILLLLRPRLARSRSPALAEGAWLTAAALALVLWGSALALERWGPQPAVLLDRCSAGGADLPAGSEVWVTPAGDEGWAVPGGPPGLVCPARSVGLLDGVGS